MLTRLLYCKLQMFLLQLIAGPTLLGINTNNLFPFGSRYFGPSLSHGIQPFWLDLRVATIVFSGVRAGNLLLTHLRLRIAAFRICMWLRFAEPSVTTIAR